MTNPKRNNTWTCYKMSYKKLIYSCLLIKILLIKLVSDRVCIFPGQFFVYHLITATNLSVLNDWQFKPCSSSTKNLHGLFTWFKLPQLSDICKKWQNKKELSVIKGQLIIPDFPKMWQTACSSIHFFFLSLSDCRPSDIKPSLLPFWCFHALQTTFPSDCSPAVTELQHGPQCCAQALRQAAVLISSSQSGKVTVTKKEKLWWCKSSSRASLMVTKTGLGRVT